MVKKGVFLKSLALKKCMANNKTRSTLDLVRALLNLLLILVVLPHLLDEVVLVDPMELWLLLLVLQLEGRGGCRGSVVGLSEGWACCSWNGLIFSLLVVQGVPLQCENFLGFFYSEKNTPFQLSQNFTTVSLLIYMFCASCEGNIAQRCDLPVLLMS